MIPRWKSLVLATLALLLAQPALAGPTPSYPIAAPLTGAETTTFLQAGSTVQVSVANLLSYSAHTLLAGSKAALQAIPSTAAPVVVRYGYTTPGDAPTVAYTPSTSACSLNAGAGDGGLQVPSADGKCWIANFPASGADARQWGVVADGYSANDGAISSASPTFSSASRPCAAADVGKVVVISGAAASSGALQTTVLSCNGTAFTLAANASTTQASAQWALGSDNSAALATATADDKNGKVCLPSGQVLLLASSVTLNHVTLCGAEIPQNRIAANGQFAQQGSVVLLASASVKPFLIQQSAKINGVSFFWPGQSGIISTPVVYPPLLNDDGVNQLSDFTFENANAINAYDFFTQNVASVVMGGARFLNTNVYAVHRAFSLSNVGETIFVTGGLFNPSVWYGGAVTNANLGTWTANNGSFLYVFGSGNGTTCGAEVMGGFSVNGGTTIVGERFVVNVDTGNLDETTFDSSVDANGDGQILYVNTSGSIHRTAFAGRYYPNGTFGVVLTGAAFVDGQTCTGGQPGGGNDFVLNASVIGANSGVLQVTGTAAVTVDMNKVEALNYAAPAGLGAPAYFAYIDNTNAVINITDTISFPAHTGANYRGIQVNGVALLNVVGATCKNTYFCVNAGNISGGTANIVGVTSSGTTSATSLSGTFGSSVHALGNVLDIPNAQLDAVTATPTLVDPNAAYYLPASNGLTYTMNGTNNSVQIDNAVNSVTTATVVLPASPLDGQIVAISADATLTLTLNAASGDLTTCGSGTIVAGRPLPCIFHKGIGATAPHGKWFDY